MNTTRDYHTKWSQKEGWHIPYDTHLHMEFKIWHKWTYLWNRIRDRERGETGGYLGGGLRDWVEWEVGVRRKLLYTEWVNNKVPLRYSTENYIQYPMINHKGKEYLKKPYIHTLFLSILFSLMVWHRILCVLSHSAVSNSLLSNGL